MQNYEQNIFEVHAQTAEIKFWADIKKTKTKYINYNYIL